jgi:hypothetical protein
LVVAFGSLLYVNISAAVQFDCVAGLEVYGGSQKLQVAGQGGVKLSKLPGSLAMSYRTLSTAHHPTSRLPRLPLEFRQREKATTGHVKMVMNIFRLTE